jgi:hypothetical protein
MLRTTMALDRYGGEARAIRQSGVFPLAAAPPLGDSPAFRFSACRSRHYACFKISPILVDLLRIFA